MVKLTPELIQNGYQHINAVKDRELDLRGYKIPMIENLGATLNQFDTIDFSDNDIRKLDNFPLLPRLKTILANNNRIVRLGTNLHETVPSIETLILTNNLISELGDLENIAKLTHLRHLSLLFNPVSTKEHYRLFVIFKLSQLKVLDFRKIKLKEREEAKLLFKSKKGKELRREISQNKSAFDEEDEIEEQQQQQQRNGVGGARKTQSQAEIQAIKRAIRNASSLEEIERLNQLLRTGQIPQHSVEQGTASGRMEQGEDSGVARNSRDPNNVMSMEIN